MNSTDIESYKAMEDIVQGLGFKSVFDFTKNHVQSAIREKIAYYQARVDFFEKKYGVNFQEFSNRIPDTNDADLSKFGISEKENDYNDWDDAVDFIQLYSQKMQQIIP
jgi:hypothetical protein